jgi:hypothetical protein
MRSRAALAHGRAGNHEDRKGAVSVDAAGVPLTENKRIRALMWHEVPMRRLSRGRFSSDAYVPLEPK